MRTFFSLIGIERIVILLLIFATLFLFTTAPRYQIDSENLIDNSDFKLGFKNWVTSSNCGKLAETAGTVLLENQAAPCTIFLRQHLPLPQDASQLILAAEVFTHNALPGKLSWQRARLSLVGIDNEEKKMWHHPHMIKLPVSSAGWRQVSQVFSIPDDAVKLVVGLEIMETTGTLSVRNITLSRASENSWFPYAAHTLLIFWGVAFLWLAANSLQLFHNKKMQVLFLLVSGAIIIGCMIPGKVRDLIVDQAKKSVKHVNSMLAEPYSFSFAAIQESQTNLSLSQDIAGHFFLFAVLAFLCRIGLPKGRFLMQYFTLALFAASTEVLQFFIPDRKPTFFDWFLDLNGLLLGFLLAELLIFRYARKSN